MLHCVLGNYQTKLHYDWIFIFFLIFTCWDKRKNRIFVWLSILISTLLFIYLYMYLCRYMFETCLKVADSFSAYFLFVHFNVLFLRLLTNLVPSFCLCVLCGNRFPFHVELFMSPQKWFSITLMWNKEISFLPRSFISTSLLHFTSLPSALFLEASHFLKQEKNG